jgi:hypothetical protein
MYCGSSRRGQQARKKEVGDGNAKDIDWDYLQSVAFGVLSMTPETFWNMTYAEFCLALEGYHMTRENSMSDNWWTANLMAHGYHNPKKFPKLNSLIGRGNELTDEERESTKDMLSRVPKTRNIKGK